MDLFFIIEITAVIALIVLIIAAPRMLQQQGLGRGKKAHILFPSGACKNRAGYKGFSNLGAYLATLHDDADLREKTAKLWSELNGVTILPDHINCQGCRANGAKTMFCESFCEIRKCAAGKKVETCGACPEMTACETVGAIISNNDEARENLKNNQ